MDSLFFYLSKLAWTLLSPDALLLLCLLLGFLLLRTRFQGLARKLIGLSLAAFFLIACLPVDEWLIYPLETRFPTQPPLTQAPTGIVVLGGAIDGLRSASWQQPELNGAGERLSAAVTLARRYPDARIVFTGGSGLPRYPTYREADYARDWFLSQGLPEGRVFFESSSRNTWENALYTKAMVSPSDDEHWLLVTSASHMPRAMGIFCQQGWAMQAWPVDQRSSPGHLLRLEFDFANNLQGLTRALYEWAGLTVYALTGKTSQWFPGHCRL